MKGSQRTLLFLIADTGAGHRSAANALRNAITIIAEQEQQQWLAKQQEGINDLPAPPTYRIEIVDVFEEYSRFPLREAVKLYGPTIRYNPKLYGRLFHASNHVQSVKTVKTIAGPLVRKGLLRLITSVQPDVIVSVHPMLNHVTVEAIQALGLKIPFITVVTDLVSVHQSWYAAGVDACLVPTEQARQLYIQRGLDPARVHVLGMPIDPKFTLPMPSKAQLQQQFELDPQLPTVLLVGGGDGAGGLRTTVSAISQARLPVQVMVVTGRNKRLFVQLHRLHAAFTIPVKIFGFVQNMPEMMHAADVLITKAGPGTICEALACDLPLILSSFVPGQEEGNVTFVIENNVGTMARDPASMVNTLRSLITPGSDTLNKQLENARRVSRPRAAFEIAKHILAYLPAPGTAGIWQDFHVPRVSRFLGRRQTPLIPPASEAVPSHLLGPVQRTPRATGPLDAERHVVPKTHRSFLKRLQSTEQE